MRDRLRSLYRSASSYTIGTRAGGAITELYGVLKNDVEPVIGDVLHAPLSLRNEARANRHLRDTPVVASSTSKKDGAAIAPSLTVWAYWHDFEDCKQNEWFMTYKLPDFLNPAKLQEKALKAFLESWKLNLLPHFPKDSKIRLVTKDTVFLNDGSSLPSDLPTDLAEYIGAGDLKETDLPSTFKEMSSRQMQSDQVRHALMAKHGGLYIDATVFIGPGHGERLGKLWKQLHEEGERYATSGHAEPLATKISRRKLHVHG